MNIKNDPYFFVLGNKSDLVDNCINNSDIVNKFVSEYNMDNTITNRYDNKKIKEIFNNIIEKYIDNKQHVSINNISLVDNKNKWCCFQ